MAKIVTWGDTSVGKSNSSKSADFLKIKAGTKYTIRPIGPVISFGRYYIREGDKHRMAICEDPTSCPVYLERKDSGMKQATSRYAAFVIDRSDGTLKVLDMPYTIYRGVGSRKEIDSKDPGSFADGSDYIIIRTDNKVKGGKTQTKYDIHFVSYTPLDESERKMVLDFFDGSAKNIKVKLQERFKVDSPEEIERKLFGPLDEKEDSSDEGYSDTPEKTKTTFQNKKSSHEVSNEDTEKSDDGDELDDSVW